MPLIERLGSETWALLAMLIRCEDASGVHVRTRPFLGTGDLPVLLAEVRTLADVGTLNAIVYDVLKVCGMADTPDWVFQKGE